MHRLRQGPREGQFLVSEVSLYPLPYSRFVKPEFIQQRKSRVVQLSVRRSTTCGILGSVSTYGCKVMRL